MSKDDYCIYCAGPLFNPKEREEMLELATALEDKGFATFLPQRDGLEHSKCVEHLIGNGFDKDRVLDVVAKAIFALDVYHVLVGCDALAVNLNGRVPDEGAVSEAAIAWRSGKPLVAYKTDSRYVFQGQDNPLVTGLFSFTIHDSMESAVCALQEMLSQKKPSVVEIEREEQLKDYLSFGKEIWEAIRTGDKAEKIASLLGEKAKTACAL